MEGEGEDNKRSKHDDMTKDVTIDDECTGGQYNSDKKSEQDNDNDKNEQDNSVNEREKKKMMRKIDT